MVLRETILAQPKKYLGVLRATPTDLSKVGPLYLQMIVPHLYFKSYFSMHSNRSSKSSLLYTILLWAVLIDPLVSFVRSGKGVGLRMGDSHI